ncbi:MAG: hypothetical protein DBX66_00035 [Clostridiales bacterium]|nr:MAG: hypothetical protein DBX66_00035 [Clostridiales bacterium]
MYCCMKLPVCTTSVVTSTTELEASAAISETESVPPSWVLVGVAPASVPPDDVSETAGTAVPPDILPPK